MNRRLKRVLQILTRQRPVRSSEQSLQAYLDSLCAPLTDLLSADQYQQVRWETEGHLNALIAELRAEGMSAEAATEAALRAYGDPHALGRAIARTWNAGRPLRRRRAARLAAFLCVSLMLFESGALLELYAFDPSASATPLGVLLAGLSALAILVGCATAMLIRVRSAAAIAKMASVWLLYAFAGGFAMRPQQNGLGIALFLLCVSLPISALVAWRIGVLLTQRASSEIATLSKG